MTNKKKIIEPISKYKWFRKDLIRSKKRYCAPKQSPSTWEQRGVCIPSKPCNQIYLVLDFFWRQMSKIVSSY